MQDQLLNPMRPHRNLQERMPSLDRMERKLVSGFLRRYVQWAAKTGRHDCIAGAIELHAWINRQPVRATEFARVDARGPDVATCRTMWDSIGPRRQPTS